MTRTRIWKRLVKKLSLLVVPKTRKKVLHTHINGYQILVLANEDVGRSIRFSCDYEPAETMFLTKFLSDDSICLDVGANVGYYTLLMAVHAPRGQVYAFEPIEINAALLRASTALNGLSNIEIIRSAIGATIGETRFSQSVDTAYSSLFATDRNPTEREISVQVTTLDQFVKEHSLSKIDVLKVDVEGAEGLVVEGAKLLLSDPARRPRLVLLELYQPNLAPFKTDVLSIVNLMVKVGYTPFFVSTSGGRVPFSTGALNEFYNVFFQVCDEVGA